MKAAEPGRLRIALCTRFRDASAPDGACVDAALSVAGTAPTPAADIGAGATRTLGEMESDTGGEGTEA